MSSLVLFLFYFMFFLADAGSLFDLSFFQLCVHFNAAKLFNVKLKLIVSWVPCGLLTDSEGHG